jgi:DNA-binding SARP family transcriptional activator
MFRGPCGVRDQPDRHAVRPQPAAPRPPSRSTGGRSWDAEPRSGWCQDDRSAFRERFGHLLQRIAELKLDSGDLPGAEQAARRLLGEDACREDAHRLLMVCYARQDQGDLVARQFRRCTARLRADLEIDPSPETVRLYRRLTTRRLRAALP